MLKTINIRGVMDTSARLDLIPRPRYNTRFRYRMMQEVDGSSPLNGNVLFNTSEGIRTFSPPSRGLKIMVIRGHSLNQMIGEASAELVWLRLYHIGRRNLPSQLSLKNLRVLEIYEELGEDNHFKELWKDASDAPIQLRELVISGCLIFRRIPKSIGSLKHLKKMIIEVQSDFLKSLPRDFCLLQSLEHLKLCCQLSSLPENFGDLRNLRYLQLSGCWDLKRLPVSFKALTLLQYLHLEGLSKLTIETDIMKDMRKLEYVNLLYCEKLEELPTHVTNQHSLAELNLSTESLRDIPVNIGQLNKLQKLFISSKLLTSLPASLGYLSSLTSLELSECTKLESLPDSLKGLSSLTFLQLCKCPQLRSLPESLGNLSSLTSLVLRECPMLELLPDSVGGLSSLTDLIICGCKMLESLPDSIRRLLVLDFLLIELSGMKSLPKSLRELINLQELCISSCPISEFDFGSGPLDYSLCNLRRIKVEDTLVSKISISEDSCPGLESLSLRHNSHLKDIEVLPNTIKAIKLFSCKMLRNIRAIDCLVNIQKLKIIGCPELDALPSVAKFPFLQEFELNRCKGPTKIKDSEYWTELDEFTAERLRRLQLSYQQISC